MKTIYLLFFFNGFICSILAQNEVELFRLEYQSTGQMPIENDRYQVLNNISSTNNNFSLTFAYGHPVGEKGLELFYVLNFKHNNQKLDLSKLDQDSTFNTIPINYYQQASYSQISFAAGLTKSFNNKWKINGLFSLAVIDDFFQPILKTKSTFATMAYLEKKLYEQFTYGFGFYLNQLNNRIFTFPVLSLEYQNKKRGIAILFPLEISVWQKIKTKTYLQAKASYDSYSLKYDFNNKVNATDIFAIKASLTYNYLWENFLKFSFGLDLPLNYYTINAQQDSFNYVQQNALGFHASVSLIIMDDKD